MTRKNIFLLLIIILVAFLVFSYFKKDNKMVINDQDTVFIDTPPSFAWKFEEADSLNLDGFPNTNIFLEAAYYNGEIQGQLIDTTPGSCNVVPNTDEDSAPNTTNIQCYSAGLGYRFKITKGETSYLVERKTFEEALPDYNPPHYEYEVVAEFSFYK